MTHSNDLSCKELVELVTEYLENSLPFGEKARWDTPEPGGMTSCAAFPGPPSTTPPLPVTPAIWSEVGDQRQKPICCPSGETVGPPSAGTT